MQSSFSADQSWFSANQSWCWRSTLLKFYCNSNSLEENDEVGRNPIYIEFNDQNAVTENAINFRL